MGEQEKNLHEKRRERMRTRVMDQGMESLLDHELLEYILYYAIPRGDTNPIAHRLLAEFQTVAGVFEADYHQLLQVEGIGPKAAGLLITYGPALKRYSLSKMGDRPKLNTRERAVEYARGLYIGATKEILYLLCLDVQCNLKRAVVLHEGTVDQAVLVPRTLLEEAIRHGAKNCILAHNHLSNSALPSNQDIQTTRTVLTALTTIDVNLLDHIIISNNGYFSFVGNDLLQKGQGGAVEYAADMEQ
ncbi:hypothetical protein LJC20_05715 [Eubacteriales bacterium OttesenSCG-928-M02]|nr:hypothetical protein [Eubacteriales bacterium OttesenSCG-928-M02]